MLMVCASVSVVCKVCHGISLGKLVAFLVLTITTSLGGCGLYTPVKDVTQDDKPIGSFTPGGAYESGIVSHVTCEIKQGLVDSKNLQLPWLHDWGTTVTQTITVEDQGGVAPGVTLVRPMQNAIFRFPTGGNVTAAQSFTFGFGITASANALRTETIQYTFRNRDVLGLPEASCKKGYNGVLIDGDLRIREFIHDKATIAALRNTTLGLGGAGVTAFNTFTEEITFVAAYGGTATPTWKLARISANTSSNLLVGQRTITNDLVITLGPLKNPRWDPRKSNVPAELIQSAMNQHNTRVQAAAIAVSITGQSH